MVTGARGYVGGRLVRHLAAKGYEVTGTTRSDATRPVSWPADSALVRLNPLGDEDYLKKRMEGIDCVVHLAAANEHRSGANPDAALMETAAGTRRLFAAATQAGVGRFVFLSTVHVYGTPLSGILAENRLPRPAHAYSITHLAGEMFVLAGSSAAPTGVVVRLSNAIGAPARPGVDRWTLLGNDLVRQACETGRVVVRAPEQWRDFIAMEDVCRGIELLCRSSAAGGIYNLGSGRAATVGEVARRTADIASRRLGRPIELEMPERAVAASAPFTLAIDRLRTLGFSGSSDEEIGREIDETVTLIAQLGDASEVP